ncbi:MAG: hypothetical protein ACC633_01900 [Anaerolineales bacterium]
MSDLEIKADIIEVLESGIFKTEYVFQSREGILGIMSLKAGKSDGIYKAADGTEMLLKKTSFWKSNYEWRDGETLVGGAMPRKALRPTFIIKFQGNSVVLSPGGNKARSWRVRNSSNQEPCEIQPRGVFKRGARLLIRAEIPIGLLVFCYCLVSIRWQERTS